MSTRLDIVDIHAHLWPPQWGPGGKREKTLAGFPRAIYDRITSPDALAGEFSAAGIDLAVVSATVESLFGASGPVDPAGIAEANDWLAGLAQRPGFAAFAVVDAYAGDAAAREAERAIVDLGLAGLVIDSARDGRFLADPAARPTLAVAARYGVPVFVHPVAHPDAEVLVRAAGPLGNSAGRGLMNGVALLSVLEAGILDAFPDLDLVFAALGLGAVVQAARGGRFGRDRRDSLDRPNIYFDTMGHDPAIIRLLVDFFGAERILAGTDWPILPALQADALAASLSEAGLELPEARLVAGGNARRLLGRRRLRQPVAAE